MVARSARSPRVSVRKARPSDVVHAAAASRLIRSAASQADIARRSAAMLAGKIESGRAVLALRGDELVGFGYFSEWEGGKYLSHSGLVVREDFRGRGLARRLKERILRASQALFPEAITMSLTTSPAVQALNRSLGFRDAPLEALTSDEEFWKGCRTCRNYAAVQAAGLRCCCKAMILKPSRKR
jgi:GNAT superfamily N-acetyltransferase